MLSRAEALYARAAIVKVEVDELAEALRKCALHTYRGFDDVRGQNYARSIGAAGLAATAEIERLRDMAYELARAVE